MLTAGPERIAMRNRCQNRVDVSYVFRNDGFRQSEGDAVPPKPAPLVCGGLRCSMFSSCLLYTSDAADE